MVELYGDERLDYLFNEELRIIQSPSVFSFSLDAVLLAHFAYLPIQKGQIVDFMYGQWGDPIVAEPTDKRNDYRY